jgi:hypothetical protein
MGYDIYGHSLELSEPYTLWGSHCANGSVEFRHAKDVKTVELTSNCVSSDKPS